MVYSDKSGVDKSILFFPDLPLIHQNIPTMWSLGLWSREPEDQELGFGVPVVAQWLMNPTGNHEVAGSVPALAQWVNDPALS